MVVPRLAQRAGAFAFAQLPDQVDSVWNKIRLGGTIIADATSTNLSAGSATRSTTSAFVQKSAMAAKAVQSDEGGLFSWVSSAMHFEGIRGFGSMFSYFSSRWALITFAVSIVLNRTHFYASSRQNLRLRWKARLCIYLIPIALLLTQTLWVLQVIKCQTSPDFPLHRYGSNTQQNPLVMFGGDGGFMYQMSSALLFWQDDEKSCAAMGMTIKDTDKASLLGSFSFVWPFFVTICISQFVETLACALQGRQPMSETGMTIFEHSLAFAECEAMISSALDLGRFSGIKAKAVDASSSTASDAMSFTRTMILRRLNVPSEVLLICFISCLSHLTSAVLAVTGKRHRWRLVSTGIWAMCYLGAFIWSFVRLMNNPLGGPTDLGILRFPTVCIVGFVPHALILCGIAVCATIYGLALLITAISPPGNAGDLTLKQRFSLAFHNLQANVQFSSSSSIKLNWQEDFYTNLLKIGFTILTAASEAVYLNEGSRIKIHDMTWLERKRLDELTAHQRQRMPHVPPELQGDSIARGLEHSDQGSAIFSSGYANERRSRARKKDGTEAGAESGLGHSARRNRWELVVDFLGGVGQVAARTTALMLSKLGLERRPRWLFRRNNNASSLKPRRYKAGRPRVRDFWVVGEDGSLTLPKDDSVDVEAETRRRFEAMSKIVPEQVVDANLYSWFLNGGWWGDTDGSGDYEPTTTADEDTTSVVSEATSVGADQNDWEWESDEGSGHRTPTLEDPFPDHASEPPTLENLVRLLDPSCPEEREEAKLLAQHLQSNAPLTRSAYNRRLTAQRSRVLLPPSSTTDAEADEEGALEAFILSRRQDAARHQSQSGRSWDTGGDGLGSSGPVCVVCQSAPRSVLVWPCGCLSVCDDCRVGVAARNFSTCLCCRTNVVAYSRLYVP